MKIINYIKPFSFIYRLVERAVDIAVFGILYSRNFPNSNSNESQLQYKV